MAVIGLVEPPGRIAGGEIRLEGQRIDDLPRERMRRLRGGRIGTIFQDPLTSLDPLYTVGEQLVETIRTHLAVPAREARERALAMLAEVGIPAPGRRIDQYPHEFSGGMRQRVVIALALCAGPRLVIADEPTTALDVSTQAQIVALLKRLTRSHGTAVVLITHDMGVIAEMCDKVAVMYAGQIVEYTDVLSLFDEQLHPYAEGLLAAIPVLGLVQKHLAVIPGSVPNLIDLPPGCKFAPRCPYVRDLCTQREPRLVEARPGHLVRCFMRDPETSEQWAGVGKATWQFGGDEVLIEPLPGATVR
jgi:peptide/nickel transport system ATP-binding protein